MKRHFLPALPALAALLLATGASAADEPLRIYGSETVLEIAPILIAVRDGGQGAATVHNGGVPNLWNVADPVLLASTRRDPAAAPPTFAGLADLAANAETQVLRMSVAHPDVRIIMTVTEGLYEIVGRRSSGIAAIADLKGKRIATYGNTSAAFYLRERLAEAGIAESEVTIVSLNAAGSAQALIDGTVDALAMWEPDAERARAALGADAIELAKPDGYRELYSLSARTSTLADPGKRRQIVALLKGVIAGCRESVEAPSWVQGALSARTRHPTALIAASWKHHRFPCAIPADLTDTMVREEAWLAARDKRAPRSRAEIAGLVDPTVLAEARGR